MKLEYPSYWYLQSMTLHHQKTRKKAKKVAKAIMKPTKESHQALQRLKTKVSTKEEV